ncbi:ABC transporter permease [Stackebrandtia nassauensis]|uniref:Transport permease protein n=1 Tax=Stackebrandtia nassauensis (strain DSM 44728 / CIP 108903 / NRRL B-16338 / NBRC 102104 / LLR-40K-21) TaxID=446470 RepID=D3PVA1_STANL|nr:ABC transporter permease [Stackebrandtia nassauensis]ADD41154.1 ABC-2 type transporter [Stackebrandtia nassauensis DSM 44728]
MKFFSDTGKVFIREIKPTLYDPISPLFSLAQPIIFLALLGPLVANMPSAGGDTSWQWFVPGILVMVVLFGTSMTGSNLGWEMQTGSHERVMVTPLSRSAMLVGKSLKEIAPLAVQTVLIVVIMLPFGFKLYFGPALLGLVILAVMAVGLGALSYALAIAARKKDWLFWAIQQTALFPLLILSGMMMPLDYGPQWMRNVSTYNPVTYIVDAERALFSGELATNTVMYGALAALGFAVVGLLVGTTTIRRATV